MENKDLKDFVLAAKAKKKIVSISYIQREQSIGFIKANQIFNELVEKECIDKEGNVLLSKEDEKTYKAIFLDIDGVLNCSSTKDLCGPYRGIEDEKVALLKEIVEKTDSLIVLVSSWKENWFKDPRFKDKQDELANYLDEKLNNYGLVIFDKTDEYSIFGRGDSILEYIRTSERNGINITKFVILDDELWDYKETKLTKNLIQTSFYKGGLQKVHIRKVINRFL